jgi:hypothetical protein
MSPRLKADKRDADQTKNMKAALAELAKLLKNAKVVKKDLDAATKLARKDSLAKIATAKDFRDTALAKQFASLYAWEQSGQKFLTSMKAVVAPFPYPKPPAAIADLTVTFDSIKETVELSGAMKKTLARL